MVIAQHIVGLLTYMKRRGKDYMREDEEKSTNDACISIKKTYEATCLLTVIKTFFIGSIPVRVIQHHVTIVMIWRISSHASIIPIPTKEFFAASFHCTG